MSLIPGQGNKILHAAQSPPPPKKSKRKMQIHGSGFGAWDSVFLRSSLGDSEVGNPWVTHWESYLENSSLELVCFPCVIYCLISYRSSPFIQIPLCQWICGKSWSLTVSRLINSDTSPCHFQRYPVNISRGARGIWWGWRWTEQEEKGKAGSSLVGAGEGMRFGVENLVS